MQKIAFINLETKEINLEDLSSELERKFLGGRGINSYFLYKFLKKGIPAESKNNLLIVGTGIFTGYRGLAFARTTISGKSPESGILGDANIGGNFGVNLKKTGISYLVIRGIAEKPIYILVEDEKISFHDANFLWGKDAIETGEELTKIYGQNSGSLVIGPAGENKVAFACVMNRKKNAAARSGMGCLMGIKQIKAIVAKGTKEIKIFDSEKFDNLIKELLEKLNKEFLMESFKEYGTAHLYTIINDNIGMGRVYNGKTSIFAKNQNISADNLKDNFYKGKAGCIPCVINCQHKYTLNLGDRLIENEGPEYGVMAHLGPVLGITRLEEVLELNDLINRLGLDASSCANLIAWSIELFEKGFLSKDQTQGLELEWGNFELIKNLINLIAQRQGFGNFLADGAKECVKKFPPETKEFLFCIKNLPQSDPVDLRFLPAYALGDAVASRGADHLRSRPIWEAFGLSEEQLKNVYGGKVSSNSFSYEGKGRVIWWWEAYVTMFDLLGLCKLLAFHCLPGVFDFEVFAKLINAGTGLNLTAQEVFDIGRRVNTIERLFLIQEGISRKDDFPNKRHFKELEIQDGLSEEEKNIKLDLEKYNQMLDEYYELAGWDTNGIPTKEMQVKLGLESLK